MAFDPEKIYGITLGIIGGGQLGKMLAQKAKTMGLRVVVLDPTPLSPAGEVCDKQIVSDFFDLDGFLEIAGESDVLTYEFEHISASYLKELEDRGYIVRPSSDTLEIIQDKRKQKEFLESHDIPVAPFMGIDDLDGLKEAVKSLGIPSMLKTSKGGYDGKGNYLIEEGTKESLKRAYEELGGDKNSLYLENHIDFQMEVSVMAARNNKGEIVIYPVVENVHQESILHTTTAPSSLPKSVVEKVKELSTEIMALYGDVGIFGIEYFIDQNDEVFVNEIAPRPHNSGHYTIEACDVSQFETHLRAILDLPLVNPTLLRPAVMVNLLGEKKGAPVAKGLGTALEIEGLSFHLYRKNETRPGRKMGHFTVTADTVEKAKERADEAFKVLRIIGE